MGTIAKRIERAEGRLGLDHGPTIVSIVWFGGKPVPAEQQRDNVIVRYVAYETIQRQREGGAGHEH